MSVPRIIFVNRYFHPDISATSVMLGDLVRPLVARGLEVHVVCSQQRYEDPTAALPREELVHGAHVHRVPTSKFGRRHLAGRAFDYASFYVSATLRLLQLVRRGDVVVAKTDPPLISVAAGAVATLKRARLVNWLQDVYPEIVSRLAARPLPGWADTLLTTMRNHSLQSAHMNVVIGSRMRELLIAQHVPAERIRLIENWADGDAVVPLQPRESRLRNQLGMRADQFVIGYSGNMGRAHECSTLLGAALALREDPRYVFLMIGGGAMMDSMRVQAEAARLHNVIFLPYQPRESLSDSLAAADVHVACLLPQMEGLIVPSKVYGIFAAARPTIFIGDTEGEIARVVGAAGCGVGIAVGDVAGLAAVIRQWQSDSVACVEMGERARQLLMRQYTVGRAVHQWLSVIAEIGAPIELAR